MKLEVVQAIIDILRKKKNFDKLYQEKIRKELKKHKDKVRFYDCALKLYNSNRYRLLKIKNNKAYFSNEKIKFIVNFIYPSMATEVFGDEIYKFHSDIDTSKKYIILDIGANRGYASLYFAEKDWCEGIYSFELVPDTGIAYKENLKLNPELATKIHFYNFGLGKEDAEIKSYYFPERDGLSSWDEKFLQEYAPNALKKSVKRLCKIKKASSTLKKIIEDNKLENIILKIDVEGAEYDIFDDLATNYPELFEKIEIIVGDTHYGFDKFWNIIKNFNLDLVWKEPNKNGFFCPFEIRNNRGRTK